MIRKIKLGGEPQEIEILSANYSKYNAQELFNLSGNPKRYVLDGEWRFFNQAELEAEELERSVNRATKEAEGLYKELKANRFIVVDSVEYDLRDSFEFDFQRKAGGNIRIKVKGKKTITKTKQETDSIETALFAYLNSVADAFDADMDAIEAGDYSNSNLKAL